MNPLEAAGEVTHWFHHDKESTVTETAQTTDTAGPDQSPASFWGMLHHNVDLFTGSMERFLPRLRAIALNPVLDDGVEALIAAFGGPMPAEVFDAVIVLLKVEPKDREEAALGLLKTIVHQDSQPAPVPQTPVQPSFTAAPADGSGTQAQAADARTVVQ